VTFRFDTPGYTQPTVIAASIGDGPYTVQALSSAKLTLSIPSGQTKFSVAFLCPTHGAPYLSLNDEYIDQETLSDGTSFTRYCYASGSSGGTTGATLHVDSSAIPGASFVTLGHNSYLASPSGTDIDAGFSPGTYDIPVTVEDSHQNTLAVRILRHQTFPGTLNGGASLVFTTADQTVSQSVTYNDIPSGFSAANPYIQYTSAGGASLSLNWLDDRTTSLVKLPDASFQNGDYYLVGAEAYTTTPSYIGVEKYSTSNGSESFTFPPPWLYTGPSAAKLPTFNFAYSGFAGLPDVAYQTFLVWSTTPNTSYDISMYATANYRGQSASMTIPDLTGLPGFLPSAASGTKIAWTAEILQGHLSMAGSPNGTLQYVYNVGNYVQP